MTVQFFLTDVLVTLMFTRVVFRVTSLSHAAMRSSLELKVTVVDVGFLNLRAKSCVHEKHI